MATNELEKKDDSINALTSAVTKAANAYLSDVTSLDSMMGVPMTDGGKLCALNLVSELVTEFGIDGIRDLDRNDIIKALQFVSVNELNVYSSQCYVDKRKKKSYDQATKSWVTKTSFTIQPQGDAFELMVAKFGVGVKKDGVHRAWLVHDGDGFTNPAYDGIRVTPPTFKPDWRNMSKPVLLVVYPIEKEDGTVDYVMADRASVAHNLAAHILNNKLGDKPNARDFDGGWKSDEFKKAQADYNQGQAEMRKYLDGKTYEEMMADATLDQYISPAWKSPSAKESMVVRKMKKNALAPYTRDMGARTKLLDDVDDDRDPAFKKDVVSEQDGEEKNETPKPKIAAVSVSEDGEIVKAEPKKEPIKPSEAPKAQEAPKEADKPSKPETVKPEPEKGKEAPKNEAEGHSEPEAEPNWDPDSL